METGLDFETFFKENTPSGAFQPYSYFSAESDTLTIYFADEPDYSKRLTDHITILLSTESDEPIGCRVKGVSRIVSHLPNYIHVKNGSGTKVSHILLTFIGNADEETRTAIDEIAKKATDHDLALTS